MDRVSECACVRERVRENMIVSQCVIVLFDGHISRLGHFFLKDRGSNFFSKHHFFLFPSKQKMSPMSDLFVYVPSFSFCQCHAQ